MFTQTYYKLTKSRTKTLIFTILDTSRQKKFGDCENVHSVNPLYLIFHYATGHFKAENNKKKKLNS